jgi:hypothetical protein
VTENGQLGIVTVLVVQGIYKKDDTRLRRSQSTPSIGLNVFAVRAVLPDLKLSNISRGVIPCAGGDMLTLIILFPTIAVGLLGILKQMQNASEPRDSCLNVPVQLGELPLKITTVQASSFDRQSRLRR